MPRLLVVEHDSALGRVVQRMFVPCEVNFELDEGCALAAIVDGARYDMLLCSVGMPQMTGIAFYQALVRLLPTLAPRVIFMSGGLWSQPVIDFFERCRRVVLVKPFGRDEIRAAVFEQLALLGPNLSAPCIRGRLVTYCSRTTSSLDRHGAFP